MSWSLELHNGDLTLSGTKLGAVDGPAKLVQDLRCAILERMGTDDLHLDFGSVIDGGMTSDGQYVPSMLGQINAQEVAFEIEVELRRILDQHQRSQLHRAQSDIFAFGKATLSANELLDRVSSIVLDQTEDRLVARVSLVTGTDQQFTLRVPITNEPQLG